MFSLFGSDAEEARWRSNFIKIVRAYFNSTFLMSAPVSPASRLLEVHSVGLLEVALKYPALRLVGIHHDQGIVRDANVLARALGVESRLELFARDLTKELRLSQQPPFNEPFDMIGGQLISWLLTEAQEKRLMKDSFELLKPEGLFWRTEIQVEDGSMSPSCLSLLNALKAALAKEKRSVNWFGKHAWVKILQTGFRDPETCEHVIPIGSQKSGVSLRQLIGDQEALEDELANSLLELILASKPLIVKKRVLGEGSFDALYGRCRYEVQRGRVGYLSLKTIWAVKPSI
jgi:hypothetical protein